MACKTEKVTKVTKEMKCCYMERVCNADCAAYCISESLSNIGAQLGMPSMTCFRLLTSAATMLDAVKDVMEDEDWDEDWDEDEDDDEDEEIT
ncbi:MAG: hypothetical protein QME49_00705 [bacterium]|nr:hypothetical protein [bacterium]